MGGAVSRLKVREVDYIEFMYISVPSLNEDMDILGKYTI